MWKGTFGDGPWWRNTALRTMRYCSSSKCIFPRWICKVVDRIQQSTDSWLHIFLIFPSPQQFFQPWQSWFLSLWDPHTVVAMRVSVLQWGGGRRWNLPSCLFPWAELHWQKRQDSKFAPFPFSLQLTSPYGYSSIWLPRLQIKKLLLVKDCRNMKKPQQLNIQFFPKDNIS